MPRRPASARDTDDAFSMVELLVVILVMGILLAIAVPTFLGTSDAADDRSAQSNLASSLTDASALYQKAGQTFDVNGSPNSAAFAGLLTGEQPSLSFKAGSLGPATNQGSSGSQSNISVAASADGNGLVLAAYSLSGDCFYMVDNGRTVTGPAAAPPSPYAGTTTVMPSTTTAPAGSLGLPTTVGTSFIEVKGDTTDTDCNAYQPKTSGPPATIVFSTSGFAS